MGFRLYFLVAEDLAVSIGCVPNIAMFTYLGIMVGSNISPIYSWDDVF